MTEKIVIRMLRDVRPASPFMKPGYFLSVGEVCNAVTREGRDDCTMFYDISRGYCTRYKDGGILPQCSFSNKDVYGKWRVIE